MYVIYEKIDVDIQDASETEIIEQLNSILAEDMMSDNPRFNYAGTYEKALYMKGDFTPSHEAANRCKSNAPKLTYSVTSLNCAHAALWVLMPFFI